MAKQLVKKHRVKRASKWLKKRLIPAGLRARAVQRKWRRKDRKEWPPQGDAGITDLRHYEYGLHSQHGEDGIIRYLFSQVGFESRCTVEFGFGATQCNALRLILHEGFSGLLMDGSAENCDFFNRAAEQLNIRGVQAVQKFLDRDNLEPAITGHGISGNIDFLSLDVDGNDYWFWEALNRISARVVCIEYNAGIGPDLSWTVPYDPGFERYQKHPSGFFHGASLRALEGLGRRKGYRLIGCDSSGTNAFFLRNDIDAPAIPTRTVEEAFRPHQNWLERGFSEAEQLEIMQGMSYVEV